MVFSRTLSNANVLHQNNYHTANVFEIFTFYDPYRGLNGEELFHLNKFISSSMDEIIFQEVFALPIQELQDS